MLDQIINKALIFRRGCRALVCRLFFFTLCFSALPLMHTETQAQSFTDGNFIAETVTTLPMYKPVGLTFAPDGRMFIWQENGIVRIYKNGNLLTTPFLNIQSRVNTVNDRGLLGFALDPNFSTNGYVYLAYTYEPNGNPNDTAPKTNRLTRMQADPANPDVVLPNSEIVLLGSIGTAPCSNYADGADCIGSDSDSHSAGMIRFAPDGKMFVSFGDGASYDYADRLALRAQNLNRYEGKLLRLNRDGTAPTDNPFYDGRNSVRSKIYSYGLRNPFRFALHPASGEPYIGDVGWNNWEEQNRGRGANFGWACFEGNDAQPQYQANFRKECGSISAASVTKPFYSYSRTVGAAAIGGAFYTGVQYPTQYRNNYFFADYVGDWIRRMTLDSSGNVVSVQNFATGLNGLVMLEMGPDGALYYVALATGEIRRIRYASGPVAAASANPTSGIAPLLVNFSSSGSSSPTGERLTYRWDFGDGGISTKANPSYTYKNPGNYTAKLTVTDRQNSSAIATVAITANSTGNRAPTATILTPASNSTYSPGQTVNFSGAASDPDETLPASAMSWEVLLYHDTHFHPYLATTGASGSFVVEDHTTGTFYYEIILTVTDSGGLKDTKKTRVNIASSTPTTPVYLSDLAWTYVTNGYGPVERDKSNGENLSGDGRTITLNGVPYTKGLGVHAYSEIRYALNGQYATFASDIGIDDEVGSNGSVTFEVWADGAKLFDSGVMTGASATKNAAVNVSGKQELRLIVREGADGNANDHADWANARLLR
jgi:glucose/arabinose dehydrogenase/chitodextrinase